MMRGMANPRITVYGITNCDSVKKSRAWFAQQGLEHQFHDFKKQGVPASRLPGWMAAIGWEKLLNRQGNTWRKLGPDIQAAIQGEESASALVQEQPSVIKRPVVEWQIGEHTHVCAGFAPDQWRAWIDLASGA